MNSTRPVKVPIKVFNEAMKLKRSYFKQRGIRISMFHSILALEKTKDGFDNEPFMPRRNNRGGF